MPHPYHRHRRGRATVAWTLLLAGLGGLCAASGLRSSAEYVVNFVRYVRWPDEASIPAWQVCIAGNLPSAEDRLYVDANVRGKPFQSRRVDAADALAGCNVLDLTAADPALAHAVLQHARSRAILSVGRGAEFCADGGHVCLRAHQSGRSFELNLTSLRDAKLGVSARLLMLGGAEDTP